MHHGCFPDSKRQPLQGHQSLRVDTKCDCNIAQPGASRIIDARSPSAAGIGVSSPARRPYIQVTLHEASRALRHCFADAASCEIEAYSCSAIERDMGRLTAMHTRKPGIYKESARRGRVKSGKDAKQCHHETQARLTG